MAAGNVDILLTARDQYSRQIDEMKNRVRDAQRSVNRGTGEGANAVEQLARAFRAMGSAQLVIGTATAAMGLFKGNTQDAVDALKRMPFGIGAVTRSVEEFVDSMVGSAAATEKLKQAQADLLAQQKQLADARALHAKQEETIAQMRQRLSDELTLELTPELDPEGTEGFARKLKQIQIEQRKAFEQLDAISKQHTSVAQDRELIELRKQLYNLFNLRKVALEREREAAVESARQEAQEREEITNRSLDEVRDRIREQAEEARQKLGADIDAVNPRRRSQQIETANTAFESRFLRFAPASATPDPLVGVKDSMGQLILISQSMADKLGYILDNMPQVTLEN